jgi:hypothetical protein
MTPAFAERVCSATVSVSLLAGAAGAVTSPAAAAVHLTWEVDGSTELDADLTPAGPLGLFTNYGNNVTIGDGPGRSFLTYTINAQDDPFDLGLGGAGLSANFKIENTSLLDHDYTVTLTVDLTTPLAASLFDAQGQGDITGDSNGGTMSTAAAGYAALYDGVSIFDDWTSIAVDSSGPADTLNFPSIRASGNPAPFPPTLPRGAVTEFGLRFKFNLTGGGNPGVGGDQIGFTGTMAVSVPGPGSVAILGIAGLLTFRRRRRGG